MVITRLKKRADFLRVAKTKIVAKTSTMLIQCSLASNLENQKGDLKVGFTASRRVGNAVKRNRAKRRLRSLVDQYLRKKVFEIVGSDSQKTALEFVFIAVPATVTADFNRLIQDFVKGVRWCLSQLDHQTLDGRPIILHKQITKDEGYIFKPQEDNVNVTFSC